MAIKPVCDRCGSELGEFGGLLFSPPGGKNVVKKYHICKTCFKTMVKGFKK
jgi:hypothetical protein